MSTTFHFFKIRKCPERPGRSGASLFPRKSFQRELEGIPARTSITFKSADVCGLEQYAVFHEMQRSIHGRLYDGQGFENFYQINEFDAFIDRDESLLICRAPKRQSKDFVDTLNRNLRVSFNADYMAIDFEVIKPRLQEINGVWVSQVSQPYLETMALFGKHVDRSDMFQIAQQIGQASAIDIVHDCDDTPFPIKLTSEHGICFPRKEEVDEAYFEVLRQLRRTLLAGATSEVPSRFNKRQGKPTK